MKIDTTSLTYIKNVVETAQMVGIDSVIIEPGKVRAINEDKTVVLVQEENVPSMPFNAVGLNRIGVFLNRLEIAQPLDDFAVNVKTNDDGEFARSFAMTAKGFKVDYRCANPKTIPAPKRIVDELEAEIQLTPMAVLMLQKGQTAMGADVVSLIYKDNVSFEFVDVNSDKFTHTFTDTVTGGGDSFTYKYPIKILLPLFKSDVNSSFRIGKKGMLNVTVNNLNIYVLPQV